jgi:hypothetical protein
MALFALQSFVLVLSFMISAFPTSLVVATSPDDTLDLLPLNKHGRPSSFVKRMEGNHSDSLNGLDLLDFGTFLWGAEGQILKKFPPQSTVHNYN